MSESPTPRKKLVRKPKVDGAEVSAKTEETPVKPPRAPKIGKRTTSTDSVIIKTEQVEISLLTPYHKNPRVGNVDEIAKSLHINKQFKPIVVNVGTKTGRKYEVLAGNHTFLAAKASVDWQQDGRHMHKDPWKKIYAAFVDVTDDECKRIVLADNRTAEYGTYDDKLLAQLFAELPDTVGTGYHKEEIDRIVASLPQPEEVSAQIKTLEDFRAAMPAPTLRSETDNRIGNGKWDDSEYDAGELTSWNVNDLDDGETPEEVDEESEVEIDETSIQLQAVLQLLEGDLPLGENVWQIPDLREDMLLTKKDIEGLRTWADKELTPDDGVSTFFTNFASGSRKGLPFDRTVMGFYNEDEAFEKWFEDPSWHATKFSILGLNKAVVPDYSLFSDAARAVHVYQVFKAQWIGRYLQEAGWHVAPRLQFCPTDPDTMDIALLGIPEGAPVLFFGAQNFGRFTTASSPEEETRLWKNGVSYAVQKLDPEVVIAYTGIPGKKIVEEISFGKWKGEIRYIDTVSTIRNRHRESVVKKTKARKDRLKAAKEKLAATSNNSTTSDDTVQSASEE